MSSDNEGAGSVYGDYWAKKRLLAERLPHFPVRRWWADPGLCDVERVYFDAVARAPSLLDVGAGDLRVMKKFRAAGYQGEYHTLDVGGEFAYDYRDLSEVRRRYGAVVCLDVIEHLPLERGLAMVRRMAELLEPGGALVLQTPNARAVPHPSSWDMTHVHIYNLPDLWAFLTSLGLETAGYRVVFEGPSTPLAGRPKEWAKRYALTRWLGCDYAQNIAAVSRKPAESDTAPEAAHGAPA
jgi:hypothetical protein